MLLGKGTYTVILSTVELMLAPLFHDPMDGTVLGLGEKAAYTSCVKVRHFQLLQAMSALRWTKLFVQVLSSKAAGCPNSSHQLKNGQLTFSGGLCMGQ